jgi:hypothetical protein
MERLGDHEVDERIPQELQPLVVPRSSVRVLVQPATVDQSPYEQARIRKRNAKALGEGPCVRRWGSVSRTGSESSQLACSSM